MCDKKKQNEWRVKYNNTGCNTNKSEYDWLGQPDRVVINIDSFT
jgi:hypothetical protein